MTDTQRLVSVESQTEYSVTSGATETRIFVKFYVEAVRSGMIADLGPERLQTLIVLASYMGADGTCYPTQWQIANSLGIKRETAGRRVAALAEYRWKGQPLILRERKRHPQNKTWESTLYKILPISGLRIFDK
ncbi:helix-turn-helix domain-containing protein [Paenibacillus polymyxa]|uniref:helix-turn-helix domain-containing protein n=1 Tax=Paenibacillus polymyxa TaxID=1406 RepID=UPI001F0CF4A6|nr:helix-turn-helix domain-containing protein [Paenibacillus polymyxa]UMR34016.1 helix-turn-helix domain-containing protein [Paenibacillus polymyxa]UNL92826.1 helix-turn-helix domain-containing protein [Paenibacillus polymyxa]